MISIYQHYHNHRLCVFIYTVIIGSGVGGLSCGALLAAQYGYDVRVCESHSIPGGCAHGFERDGYSMDSG